MEQESLAQLLAPDYELIGPLDWGLDAPVWEAEQPALGRRVAIHMLPETDSGPARAGAVALASVGHPHLAQVLDVLAGSMACVVTERPPGTSLRDILITRGALPTSDVLSITLQLAGALAVMHEEGFVHGGITSRAVIVDDTGQVKLATPGRAPFRPSRRPPDQWAPPGAREKLAPYAPPELLDEGLLTEAGDAYMLGHLIFEMLVGRTAFGGPDLPRTLQAHLSLPMPPVRSLYRNIPRQLEYVIRRSTARSPRMRYPDVGVMVRDIEDLVFFATTYLDSPGPVGIAPVRFPSGAVSPGARPIPVVASPVQLAAGIPVTDGTLPGWMAYPVPVPVVAQGPGRATGRTPLLMAQGRRTPWTTARRRPPPALLATVLAALVGFSFVSAPWPQEYPESAAVPSITVTDGPGSRTVAWTTVRDVPTRVQWRDSSGMWSETHHLAAPNRSHSVHLATSADRARILTDGPAWTPVESLPDPTAAAIRKLGVVAGGEGRRLHVELTRAAAVRVTLLPGVDQGALDLSPKGSRSQLEIDLPSPGREDRWLRIEVLEGDRVSRQELVRLPGRETRARIEAARVAPDSLCATDGNLWVSWGDTLRANRLGSGGTLWERSDLGSPGSRPVIRPGSVLVAGANGQLRRLDPESGKDLWDVVLAGPPVGRPLVMAGTVVVLTADGQLTAVAEADGARRWSRELGQPAAVGPVLLASGDDAAAGATVAVARIDGRLLAYDLTDARVVLDVTGPPVRQLIASGELLIGEDATGVRAVDLRGTTLWRLDDVGTVTADEDTVAVVSPSGIVAVEATSGREVLRRALAFVTTGAASITGRGVVIAGRDGTLQEIALKSGDLLWSHQGAAPALWLAPGAGVQRVVDELGQIVTLEVPAP